MQRRSLQGVWGDGLRGADSSIKSLHHDASGGLTAAVVAGGRRRWASLAQAARMKCP